MKDDAVIEIGAEGEFLWKHPGAEWKVQGPVIKDVFRERFKSVLEHLHSHGLAVLPMEATEGMVEAALDASGQRIEEYTAPRESGVAIDGDISEADAEHFNSLLKDAHGSAYRAMTAAWKDK